MAPINKKTGSSTIGKSGAGSVINKTPAGKSSSVMKFGSKQSNSSSLPGKTSTLSFGDKKASSTHFGRKTTTATSSGKNSNTSHFTSTSDFEKKNSAALSNDGKRSTASSFGGLGSSSKSPKISGGTFIAATDKTYGPSYIDQKNKKSSMKFGIIWLPTRKRNKMKDSVYNPYDNDRRDLFKERSPSMYNFMSGDTSNRQTFKKKEEEIDLLASDKTKLPATVTTVTSDGLSSDISHTVSSEEKQEFIKQNKEESKDAAGDSYEKDDNSDYLENKETMTKAPDATWEKDNSGDKVDSVYLRPPPPHKARSSASTVEEEDCGIKCLYYTLLCCDCVLM